MTNLTVERVIGLSTDNKGRLKMYNDARASEVEVPSEPVEFREFMDMEREIELLEGRQEPIMMTEHYIVKEWEGGN